MPDALNQEIPNFSTAQYENLILALVNGTCIFIGAGVSKLAGYMLWDELTSEMVDYFWSRKDKLPHHIKRSLDLSMCENLKNHENIIETFDYLYLVNKNLFISGIRDIFNSADKTTTYKIYQDLNRLNNGKNFFVTTNIDRGLQKYIGLPDESVSINPIFENPPKLVSYLHGRIDRKDTWILTTDQYCKGYVVDGAPCMNYLKHIFENYNVLFIGYGLREDEILRVISLTNKRKIHYWMEGCSRNKEDYLKIRSTRLKEHYNIDLIPYYIDNQGHELLYEVIDSLYEIIVKRER